MSLIEILTDPALAFLNLIPLMIVYVLVTIWSGNYQNPFKAREEDEDLRSFHKSLVEIKNDLKEINKNKSIRKVGSKEDE